MKLTVEISMYPLQNDYIPPIDDIINRLESHQGVRTRVTPTCTQIVGDFDLVSKIVVDEIRTSYEKHGKAVFVTKFLPDYEPF